MDTLKRIRKATMVDDELCKISPKKMKKDLGDIENLFDDSADDWCLDSFHDKENHSQNQHSPKKAANQFGLDLKCWKRCHVESVQRDTSNFDLILEVVEKDEKARAVCRLQGVWAHSRIRENQVVCLKATWSSKYECYTVNHENGMIVTDPDTLISGTTVVGSLFCKRKCILQEKFRGIDSDSKIMIIGCVVHELLQTVLKNKLHSLPEIVKASEELISSSTMIFTLYSSKMTAEEMQDEMKIFIPRIFDFVQRYILGKQDIVNKDEFQGCITDIEDIEQNLWVPRLGLKGKIDVSARVRSNTKTFSKSKLMPLELKTGKPSFSSEHKGQVTLYQLMLEELNEDVESGLLLYLRDGIMKEVKSSRNEKRDLIMLRNEVAHYLANGTTISSKPGLANNSSKTADIETLRLPEPINHHSACGKCPYNTICTTLLTRSSEEQISDNHPLKKISSAITIHLKSEHFNYFIHWCSILALEEYEEKKLNRTKDIWTEKTERRVKGRRAIDDLVISEVSCIEGRYIHTFTNSTNNEKKTEITLSKMQVGEYVLVSCADRINVAAGHIKELAPFTIKISLERDLSEKYPSQKFTVDKHFSSSGHVFNFTNLRVLLDDTEDSLRLREIVIEKKEPTFSGVLPKIIAKEGVDILADLNIVQRKAVLKALTTNQYMLIKGLPGTGKTQTIVAVIRLLDMMGKSIIITSHTHSAVDNVLLRLKNHGVKFLRLGSDVKIHPSLHEHSESKITASCKTVEELSEAYSSHRIVGVTCLGSAHSLFMYKKFDICIVDEASQVFQPTILRPLLYARKFILVGDPDQLPPVIRSKEAKDLGADESLFQRLDSTEATSILTVQYRMNRGITKLANDLIYQGSLECANDDIKLASLNGLKLQKLAENYKNQKWILRALQKHVDFSTIFLDTEDCLERSTEFSENKFKDLTEVIERSFSEEEVEEKKDVKFQCTNYCEAAIAFTLVKALLLSGCSAKNIGIIAPYRAQVELLKKLLENLQENEKLFEGLEINTVDQFQGRDKDVIIYSCTRTGAFTSAEKSKNNILQDRRRITVAITRSKHKLIIIGDQKCLVQFTPFRDLYEKIPSRCKITLKNDEQGFSWDFVFTILNDVFHSV